MFTPELVAHAGIQSILEVGFPLWVVRIGVRFDFGMTSNRNLDGAGEVDSDRLAVFV